MFQYVWCIYSILSVTQLWTVICSPTQWCITTVTEIFKNKGETSNYRPVTLVQLVAKIFDFILVCRFQKWFQPADEQAAYQSKKGGANHVFEIRCLIQHKRLKQKLYIIAIDFDGAFDWVSRSLLIRKLILFGADTIFVWCLASIYMRTDSFMFRNDHMKSRLYSGTKQGLPLSPLIYILREWYFRLFWFFVWECEEYDPGENAHSYARRWCNTNSLHKRESQLQVAELIVSL